MSNPQLRLATRRKTEPERRWLSVGSRVGEHRTATEYFKHECIRPLIRHFDRTAISAAQSDNYLSFACTRVTDEKRIRWRSLKCADRKSFSIHQFHQFGC
jgi:hypothetical protein